MVFVTWVINLLTYFSATQDNNNYNQPICACLYTAPVTVCNYDSVSCIDMTKNCTNGCLGSQLFLRSQNLWSGCAFHHQV